MLVTVSGLSSMILVNKRRAMELFPESVTKLWNEWELRALVLLSLFLQIVLILLGNRRKYIASNWVRIIIWLAYLAADWIAAVCIGVLSNENGDDNSSQPNSLIWAFWAPFLLLHLGGPDTITAYSLEDNELWLRHFLALVIQFGGTFYIFLRSWKSKLLNILAIPIFVAGLIKYGERTWVLRSASSKTSRTVHSPPEGDILQQAYYFFETFKVAFEVVEIELGFMYDVLYTKATVTCSRWGSLLRSISLSFTISAFIAFLTIDRQEYSTIDVIITYLLLVGAIVLEIYAILVLLFSDWTKRWSKISKSASDIEADFSHSILLWHIATDLCYENDAEKNPDCKACKVLSDYMLYLLVMCPFMLPDGIGEIRYRDSCAEAKEFFKDRKHIKSRTQACKDLLRLMRGVWVEMLCYAASQCRPNQHAKQLRRGGELLTHVWLLMAHLDVRENFQISQGNAKGGIIVS
ncbi:unnamed protein product, partial [Vitis vinifera]|uniref:DUF4220 domain-containing protein n=1 Tax=Vitis vinifera TaxID=29760 RepID=D7SWU4_VITVI